MIAGAATATSRRVPLLTRLYVWSVIFEPLLLFVVFEEAFTGVTGNVSRLLQLLVIAIFGTRLILILLLNGPAAVSWRKLPDALTVYFRRYFLLAVVAGVIGLASGAYEMPVITSQVIQRSSFASALNSQSMRPLFEYFVTLYYFVYFVVAPYKLLTTPAAITYALSRFKAMFVICFIAGVIDAVVSAFNIFLIPRHLSDWARIEPTRFHGLAGEPRQAFVYLFLALSMLFLDAHLRGRKLSKWWIAGIIMAAISTQSTSGLVGIALFLALYVVYSLAKQPARVWRVAVVAAVVSLLAILTATTSSRIMDYARSASGLWAVLETNDELPFLMSKANSDIYPLYDLTRKVREGDVLAVAIGSGFGSASAVTNRYFRDAVGFSNPHSQFARSIYESGIIGTFFFVMCFIYPVQRAVAHLPARRQQPFILLTLLIVGCFLGHRSAAPFIYLGTLVAAFRVTNNQELARAASPVRARPDPRLGPAAVQGLQA